MIYDDGPEFWLQASMGKIWGSWPENSSFDDAVAYLLGPVMGLMLLLRGTVCLHASAIVIKSRAVLFLGDAGAGKSTTAAALAQRGHALLADDIVSILEREGEFMATPAVPHVSLWPESPAMIRGTAADSKSASSPLKQRLSPSNFQCDPTRIRAIFVFGERVSSRDAPRVEKMNAREQLLALVANSYGVSLLDPARRGRDFRLFGEMVQKVPILRLIPHGDPLLLDRLCAVIEEKSKTD
ncbi:MAG TPA: hypothetical protein VMB47_01670 [Candidatus Aquilonibacter sp.]|nr:hypothetical protein [Candidatus Aquilonibacter sp.]